MNARGCEYGFLKILPDHPSQQPRFWTKGELTTLIQEQTAPKYTDSVGLSDGAYRVAQECSPPISKTALATISGPTIFWTQWAAWFGAAMGIIALGVALCR